jgi:hypothetical protein
MIQNIIKDRAIILENIQNKKKELLELEKQRMAFANNLTHQINTFQLVGRSYYLYNQKENNNLVIFSTFNKNSFRDEQGYFDLDYFDILSGKELQVKFNENLFIFIKEDDFNNKNFKKLSILSFNNDKTYLILVKYDLDNTCRKSIEDIPMNERKIIEYIIVSID